MTKAPTDNSSKNRVFPPKICFPTPFGEYCLPLTSTGPTFPVPPTSGVSNPMYCDGMSASDVHASVFRKFRTKFEENARDRKSFARSMAVQLCEEGLIQSDEESVLDEVIGIVFARKQNNSHKRLKRIHERLVDDCASPMMIAVVGVAEDSARFAAEDGSAEGPILVADFTGALAGAVITKSPLGAGAIGGTASFLAWW